MKESGKKSNENTLPQDPLERCQLRWHCLFWGVWKAVFKQGDNLGFGLLEALKRYGFDLLRGSVPENDPFKPNPSDETLVKAKAFYENPKFPRLKWKRLPWKKLDIYVLFTHYSSILFELNELPSNFSNLRNADSKKRILKNTLPLILKHIPFAPEIVSNIDDRDVAKWAKLSKKDLAVNLVAEIHELSVPNARKNLTLARKKYPEEAIWWKYGLQMIRSK